MTRSGQRSDLDRPAGPPRPARSGSRVAVASLAVLALVWITALVIRRPHGRPRVRTDTAWASAARAASTPPVTAAASLLAWLGGPGSVPVALAVALRVGRERGLRTASAFVVAALLSQRNVHLMKSLGSRRRPDGRVWDGVGSFPSGHTAYAAVIAVTATALDPRPTTVAASAGAVAAMAASRTILGAHWLSDTLAGAASGWAMAALVFAAADPRTPEP